MYKKRFKGFLDSSFYEDVNFYIAFEKLKAYYKQENELYDYIELKQYESNIHKNIRRIKREISENKYHTKAITPLPFPKNETEDGKLRIRQYFEISIDDQLIWIAIVNIIGPKLDGYIPFWSYGNRIFNPTWYEENSKGEIEEKNFGYPKTSDKTYNNWGLSWPLYKKHINLTIAAMSNPSAFIKDELPSYANPELHERIKSTYSKPLYFKPSFFGNKKANELYWMGLDYEKFFPSISIDAIFENIKTYLQGSKYENRNDANDLVKLIEQMLIFKVKVDDAWDRDDLGANTEFNISQENTFNNLPTGLSVSGFLSNIGVLEVDRKINNYIIENKNIAFFKYVDDQVILSKTSSALKKFYDFYLKILDNSNTNIKFQTEKTVPTNRFGKDNKWNYSLPKTEATLDAKFPSPIMSLTMQKMSDINNEDYSLCTKNELENILGDLTQFLLSETTESEIKKDTKLSFTASKLNQLASQIKPTYSYFNWTVLSVEKNNSIPVLEEKIKTEFLEEVRRIDNKYSQLFEVLSKTVLEQPSKLKIWKRLVELSYISGSIPIQTIFKLVTKSRLHKNSKAYIKSYIINCTNHYMFKAYNIIKDEQSTLWKLKTSFSYLINCQSLHHKIQKETQKNGGFTFEHKSKENFLNTSRIIFSTQQTLHKELISLGIKKKFIKPIESENLEGKNLVYVIDNVNYKKIFWHSNIDKISFTDTCAEYLFLMFPKEKIFQSILSYYEKLEWYNEDRKRTWILDTLDEYPNLSKYTPEFQKSFQFENENYITLHEWSNQITKIKNIHLDPRKSEWTSIELIKQIAQKIIEKNQIDPMASLFNCGNSYYQIHPKNYLIPRCFISQFEFSESENNNFITWEEWIPTIESKDNPIKIKNKKDLIYDPRYLPVESLWGLDPKNILYNEFPVVLGLGTLLAKTLSASKTWPASSNGYNFIKENKKSINSLIQSQMVSSGTIELLKGITGFKEINILFQRKEELNIEEILVKDLSSFIEALEKIQKSLIKYQYSIKDRPSKQLIPIDINKIQKVL